MHIFQLIMKSMLNSIRYTNFNAEGTCYIFEVDNARIVGIFFSQNFDIDNYRACIYIISNGYVELSSVLSYKTFICDLLILIRQSLQGTARLLVRLAAQHHTESNMIKKEDKSRATIIKQSTKAE